METHYKSNEQTGLYKICCLPAKPLDDPVWRGILVITNEIFGTTYGLAAHLSSNACVQVLQMAPHLPALLHSDVVPRVDIWPNMFTISPPSDNDIALYFFADKGGDELFESLLSDLTGRDVALKLLLIDNTELLIFTSSHLPTQHQKIEGKSYLWGVFRQKRNQACTSHHLINKTNCIMPLNSTNLISVATEQRELIKMRNTESGTRSIHHGDARKSDCDEQEVEETVDVEQDLNANHTHAESSVKADTDHTRVDSSINADNANVEFYMNGETNHVESSIDADKNHVQFSINAHNTPLEACIIAGHTHDEGETKTGDNREMDRALMCTESGTRSDCDEQDDEATVDVEPYLNAYINADHTLVESNINTDHTRVGSPINADNTNVEIYINADNTNVESSIDAANLFVESLINADSTHLESCIDAGHTQDEDATKTVENREMDRALMIKESGTLSIHHGDARESDRDEQELEATVDVELYLNANDTCVESSVRADADHNRVESYSNADHTREGSPINADNTDAEICINADTTNVGSSIDADTHMESPMDAGDTQDDDATNTGDNRDMDMELMSKGVNHNNIFEANLSQSMTEGCLQDVPSENQLPSDSSHSRNIGNPVIPFPVNISPEEALTQDPLPTIVPTAIAPAICMTIIPETSLSQFQGISGTPTFQQDKGGNSTTQMLSQSITANHLDMARIFNSMDSQEAFIRSTSVKVGRYTIKESLSSILESIIARYGDIAQGCQLPDESTSYVLELICKALQYLQEFSLTKLRSRHLKFLNTIITEARSVNIEVDWLKTRYYDLDQALCMIKFYTSLKGDMEVAASTKATLALKKEELAKAESECQSKENELISLEAEFQNLTADYSNMVSECKRFLETPLNDGLL